MLSSVFLKTVRDHRRSLLFWAIGMSSLMVVTVLFYPQVSAVPEFSEMFDESDAIARVFAGGFTDLASPEGYLNSQVFSLLVPLLLLVFTIGQGSGATAGEEERGTLDVLLSHPISRVRLLIEKLGAMAAELLGLSFVLWASVVVGALIVDMDLGMAGSISVTLSAGLLAMSFGALALAAGATTGKRGLSIGVTGAVAVVAYLLYALTPLVQGIEHGSKLSPFHYYITADPLTNGLNPLHAATLAVLTLALAAIAAFTFNRRDLAV